MLKVDADPGEVGLDPDRLRRLDDVFRSYVDDGRLPGWTIAVTRRGKVAHLTHHGLADLESGRPVGDDTLWRIYSMTKPITSVAAMMLYEQGLLRAHRPGVASSSRSSPTPRVYVGGSAAAPGTRPAVEPIRVWHLLTHTAGLTYGFHHAHAVDEMYRARGYEFGVPEGQDLAAACAAWARFPLLFDPGAEWNYSVATDVLGRVVEVVSGLPLDRFFAERILGPLGMTDTAFSVPARRPGAPRHPLRLPRRAARAAAPGWARSSPSRSTFFSGGGGLVSTAGGLPPVHADARARRRAGRGAAARRRAPLAYMTRNHLPGGVDLDTIGRPLYAESQFRGVGFGLGFSVVLDPVPGKALSSAGEFAWGGLARTAFYVDPAEEITAMFFTQLLPGPVYPLRTQLRALVTAAVVD